MQSQAENMLIEEHLRLCEADDSMIEALQFAFKAKPGSFGHTVICFIHLDIAARTWDIAR